jgi:exo-1,4-beta-D-glucosaminidase
MSNGIIGLVALALLSTGCSRDAPPAELHGRLALERGWMIQSSARVASAGAAISTPGFSTDGWYPATVPNTVVGALVEAGEYPDPYFGMNLRNIPGMTYPIGSRFMLQATPADSPFKPSWWYRTEFDLPDASAGRSHTLNFDAINYRANIWVNGSRIASSDDVAGAYRRYAFDITSLARRGRNAVAVEVFGPEPHDLSIMWVDWNPTPPDKNLGLWDNVYVTHSGSVSLRHPYVISRLDLPSLDRARLTVLVEAVNTTDREISATIRGTIGAIEFSQPVTLAPREQRTVRFEPERFPQLGVSNPRLWWPYRMGEPTLHTLSLEARVDRDVSDAQQIQFGIRQVDSELTDKGFLRFKVNGKPILIRGGGWASDMLLRPKPLERLEAELGYVRAMGLNTIRLEGKFESDALYDLADRLGILVMPGWCCCDQWEMWDKWDAEDHRVGPASQRDQLLRLRHHPSVFVWLNGSDFPPVATVEQKYLEIAKSVEWSRPIVSNATETPGPVSGPSGVKMRGPYDYEPPSYWLTDTQKGGAFGFATEIGPGAAVPPLESLQTMLPADHLWPIDHVWNYHAGGDEFKDVKRFTSALEARYGKATGVADYARKAQAMTYDGQRAMFEAYARNKYTSTGVIQWMLNNAWPSMIWHLYDYYLRPGGGYYGTKKACEPVHVQYSYDDRSVVIVNDTHQPIKAASVSARVFDLDLAEKFAGSATVDVPPDGVVRALVIPEIKGLTRTYFVRLSMVSGDQETSSRNFYWLSTVPDTLDWKKTEWFYTPTSRHADLTALARLPTTTLAVTPAFEGSGKDATARVTVENTGSALAFQVHLKLLHSDKEVLPVFWEDNYFELFPGEKREIRAVYARGASAAPPAIEADAWNASLVKR